MLRLIAAFSRCLPLVIILAVLAIIVYLILSWRKTPARAKEIMIKVFTIICSVIAGAFLLIGLYALLDSNMAVFELAISCAIVGVLGLLVTLICKAVFKKNHPHYKYEPTEKARPTSGGSRTDMLDVVTRILNWINDNRRR